MSELTLVLSDKFTESDAKSLRAALGWHLQVGGPMFVRRASADPPSTIQLLGAVVAWLPLVAAATAFVTAFSKTLGTKAANAAWDSAATWFKSKEADPLADVAKALVAAAERVDGEVRIGVGLSIPDDHFGTAIWADSHDPVEVAKKLAALITHAERISETMQVAIECGRRPIGPAIVELQEDGSVVVKWMAASDMNVCEKHIP